MDTQTANMDLMVKSLIDSLDLHPIIERMIVTCSWTKKQALLASEQYKNFLFLKKKYGKNYSLPPSIDIDEFWHNHILHTEKYIKDCQIIFNEFLHHHPQHTKNTNAQKKFDAIFEHETQALYFKEFGTYLYEVRPTSFVRKMIAFIKNLVLIK